MNYTSGIKKQRKKQNITKYNNRGMGLEEEINSVNNFYIEKNIAIIYKKPTPIHIVKIDYKTKKNPIIREAFFEQPSTTDYNGIYKGFYLDFDVKETNNLSKFPLSNILKHQIDHLYKIWKNGGIAFMIIRFKVNFDTYMITIEQLLNYIKKSEVKYIPKTFFDNNCHKISYNYINKLDYIQIIDKFLEEKNEKKEH